MFNTTIKDDQCLRIGDAIVSFVTLGRGKARLYVDAPRTVKISTPTQMSDEYLANHPAHREKLAGQREASK